MLLRCRIPLASFELDIDVSFEARVTAIFGPSGSGKTTLLDAVAGLRRVANGAIEVGDRILFSSERKINLPPRDRGIGYVPQEGALFPHLSVRKNILFGAERGVNGDNAERYHHGTRPRPSGDRPSATPIRNSTFRWRSATRGARPRHLVASALALAR